MNRFPTIQKYGKGESQFHETSQIEEAVVNLHILSMIICTQVCIDAAACRRYLQCLNDNRPLDMRPQNFIKAALGQYFPGPSKGDLT